jgi:hypothetical protein
MQVRFSLAAGAMLMLSVGCESPMCTRTSTIYTATVSAVATAGPRIGQPVARFDLTQDFLSHTPVGCLGAPTADVGVVDMTITSTATVSQRVEYAVQGLNALSVPVWSYEGVIPVLAAGQTVTVSRVAVSATKLESGARVVLKEVLPVP